MSADGRRCEARGLVEFHHLAPYEAGGQASVENIQLRCAAHNRYESECYFGPIWQARSEQEVREPALRYGRSGRTSNSFWNELRLLHSTMNDNFRWSDLAEPAMEGARLEEHYRKTLQRLGGAGGMLAMREGPYRTSAGRMI